MKVMMITGAGISTGSGLATYRGTDGRYKNIEKRFGLPVEHLISRKTLWFNPELFWAYWAEFRSALKGAEPSIAHKTIVAMANSCDEFLEVTQNVDGLSRKAGLHERHLVELHGTALSHECLECGRPHDIKQEEELSEVPYCADCDWDPRGVIRPKVVLFGEDISPLHKQRAVEFAGRCDLLVIAGTSMQFEYLLHMTVAALNANTPIIYIDPKGTSSSGILSAIDFDDYPESGFLMIRDSADRVLPLLHQHILNVSATKPGQKITLHDMLTRA